MFTGSNKKIQWDVDAMAVSYYIITGCLLPVRPSNRGNSHTDTDSYKISGVCCRRRPLPFVQGRGEGRQVTTARHSRQTT